MTTQFQNLQFKRGSKAANDALVGPRGSISIDLESQSIRVHDGSTPGGAFEIKRGAAVDAQNLQFTTAKETLAATGGQTIFTLNAIDLSNPAAVKIKVGDEPSTNWAVINNRQIQFDAPFFGGEQITFENVKSLNALVEEALGGEGSSIESIVENAIARAQQEGGLPSETDIQALAQAIAAMSQRLDNLFTDNGIDAGVIE